MFGDASSSRVKRPINAFLIWSREARKILKNSNTKAKSQHELSKMLGVTWRHLSDEQKRAFYQEADRVKQQHKIEHPNYKYQPKRKNKGVPATQTQVAPSGPHISAKQESKRAQYYYQAAPCITTYSAYATYGSSSVFVSPPRSYSSSPLLHESSAFVTMPIVSSGQLSSAYTSSDAPLASSFSSYNATCYSHDVSSFNTSSFSSAQWYNYPNLGF